MQKEKVYPAFVVPVDFNGQQAWSKRRPDTKETSWHRIQRVVTHVLPPVFRPTVTSGGPESLRQEAERYRAFAAAGIRVPEVLSVSDDAIVISNAGTQLRGYLDRLTDEQKKRRVLHNAVEALGRLHQKGLCHGRPLLRDMTIENDQIAFIDLEEDPTSVMPLADAQARDIWLFLNGVAIDSDPKGHLLQELFYTYEAEAPTVAVISLRSMVRFLQPFRWIAGWLIAPFAGQDVKRAIMANKALERAFKRSKPLNQI